MQLLVLWIFIIGVVGYLIFPGFFNNVYERLTDDTSAESVIADYSISNSSETSGTYSSLPDYTSYYYPYSSSKAEEITSGYWVMFVEEGKLTQLSLTYEGFSFLKNLVQADRTTGGEQTLIFVENGQIQKYEVSAEIYNIVQNLAIIDGRVKP